MLNYVRSGKLNMEYVVTRFHDLMYEEYRESTVPILEKEGRLLFLTFLKPIINGIGFYYVEPQTRNNRRMDLVVTYDKQEFIVELPPVSSCSIIDVQFLKPRSKDSEKHLIYKMIVPLFIVGV